MAEGTGMSGVSYDDLIERLTLTQNVDVSGTVYWTNDAGLLHRVHGPTIIWPDGKLEYYTNGVAVKRIGFAPRFSSQVSEPDLQK